MLEFLNIQKLYKRLHTTSDKALVKKIKRKTNNNGDGMDEKPFAEKLLSEDLNNEKNVPAAKSEKTISAPVKKLKKEKVIEFIPAPKSEISSPLQMMVVSVAYDNYKGKIGVGRIYAVTLKNNERISRITRAVSTPSRMDSAHAGQ